MATDYFVCDPPAAGSPDVTGYEVTGLPGDVQPVVFPIEADESLHANIQAIVDANQGQTFNLSLVAVNLYGKSPPVPYVLSINPPLSPTGLKVVKEE